MPQINENAWGSGFWLSDDYLNKRTGTSSITDTDYTNFAPFAFMSRDLLPPSPNVNTVCLQKLYSLDMCELNTPLDGSICFVGMYNSDLPQLNIGVFYVGDTQENPTFKSDNTQIQSYFMYSNLELFGYFQPTNQYMPNGLLIKPSYSSGTPSKYLNWSDNGYTGTGSNLDVEAMKQYNTNLKIDPVLKFGVKSLFLVIYVVFISSLDNSGQPISGTTTLNEYLNGVGHDDTWKQSHPVMCAYALPYIRRNVNGEYNSQVISGADICPAFTLSLDGIDDNTEHHIIQYMSATKGGAYSNIPDSCFPIYGNITPKQYNIPYAGSTEYSAPIFLGINHGEYKKAPSNNVYWFELDLTNSDNVEYLMRGCAAYGLFFSDDYYTLAQAGRDETRWIDNNMCCGTIDENGRTNGDYTRGALNATQRQYNWSDSTESPFDPLLPPVPENQYDNTTIFNSIGDSATMFKRYVLNGSNVEQLGRDLFKIVDDIAQGDPHYDDYATQINSSMLVTNPLDSIISLQRYPMAIPHGSSTAENIKLGTNTCTAIGYPMSKTAYEYAFQGKKILPRFGDSFLDYEPYTKFEMYIPFCGTVELSPRDILNRDLSARLVVDYSTGTCTGYILSDNLVIETLNGNIAINIPVSGTDNATMQANINNAVAARASAGAQAAGSVMYRLFNKAKTTSGESISYKARQLQYNIDNADYTLNHLQSPVHTIGSASPCGAWAIDLKCRLIIYYPTGEVLKQVEGLPAWDPLKLAVYGMSTGFYTAEPAQISSFTSGLLCAQNPILNSMTTNTQAYPAISQELEMIRAAIADGIIL